ncbi:hypothetical protein ACFLVB_00940 [Chloroflexota bacterium]
MEEKLIKRLFASIKCGSCGQKYRLSDIEILGHKEGMWFLRASCSLCQNSCLVAAIMGEGKAGDEITDLTALELQRFGDGAVVGADDLLNVHDFLKNFDGDFSALFEQSKS